jgi:hypothetical protein
MTASLFLPFPNSPLYPILRSCQKVLSGQPQGGGLRPPLRNPTLGQIVGHYKYQSTKAINALSGTGARFHPTRLP